METRLPDHFCLPCLWIRVVLGNLQRWVLQLQLDAHRSQNILSSVCALACKCLYAHVHAFVFVGINAHVVCMRVCVCVGGIRVCVGGVYGCVCVGGNTGVCGVVVVRGLLVCTCFCVFCLCVRLFVCVCVCAKNVLAPFFSRNASPPHPHLFLPHLVLSNAIRPAGTFPASLQTLLCSRVTCKSANSPMF